MKPSITLTGGSSPVGRVPGPSFLAQPPNFRGPGAHNFRGRRVILKRQGHKKFEPGAEESKKYPKCGSVYLRDILYEQTGEFFGFQCGNYNCNHWWVPGKIGGCGVYG